MQTISHPKIPYWGRIPEGVLPGTAIQVDGHVPHHSTRFAINLVCGHDVGHHAQHHSSIALHFNPRNDERCVVLNSRHLQNWGHEDRHHNMQSFQRGHNFSLVIDVDSTYYRIRVNGTHFADFAHRVPIHEVHTLWIDGHIDVHRIEYRRPYNMPYTPVGAFVPTTAFVPTRPRGGKQHHHHHHHHYHNK